MDATRLWRLEGVVQPYAWGSRSAIPELLGREPNGEPQAELWLGAHPRGPAQVCDEAGRATPLDAWIRDDPEAVLGAGIAQRFGGELPFLLKVLAVAAPLSIQAHPSPEQARAGFARENAAGLALDAPDRCYRDPNPKPELICALTHFRALNRFREPAEIERRIAALGVAALDPLLAPLRARPERGGLAAFFEAWMTLAAAQRRELVASLAEAAGRVAPADPAHREITRLAQSYPGDAGVLAPLFLNLVELEPGEAMYLPAGELHAYLEGIGIELMANSDNVLRGGLTAKHVDVPELLATLGFATGPPETLRAEPTGAHEAHYPTPAEHFALSELRLDSGARWESPESRGVEIVLCCAGNARARTRDGAPVELPRGSAVLAPSAAGAYSVEGEGRLVRARVAGSGDA